MKTIFMKSAFLFGWISIFLLSSLILTSCSKENTSQANRSGGGGGSAIPVEAMIIQPQLLRNTISATGNLLANEEVELRSEISGRVTGVFFDEGKNVKKGELLLKINDQELKAQLKRKELEEKQASDNELRNRKLHETNAISQEEYDKTLTSLQMVQAEKEALESQIAETEIRAPFNGVVGLRYISEGGYVTPSVLIATLQNVDPMKVEFSIPEKHAKQLKNGTKIIVRVSNSENDNNGEVYAVESMIDPGTRTIKARARIPNPDRTLIPGAFAKVEITLEEFPDAIVIPSGAVIPEISGEKVFVSRNGKAKSVLVTSGIRTERGTQIIQGLNVNDTLIVSGILQVTEGKAIQIKAFKNN
jgi:membrane fusion protein, multidrug efflux system